MKKILISTVAAAMVTTSLMAATGPGSSTITAGSDINGTVHSAALSIAAIDLNASISNITAANGDAVVGAVNFISYKPNIAIGQGNLITIKVNNGTIHSLTGNNLYLVDANSTLEQNASGAPVVAKMTDFVNSGGNYSEMTFKFISQVQSGTNLIMADSFESNATLQADVSAEYGLASRTKALALTVAQGLACADNVTLEVINSKDQSGDFFNVPNTATKSSTGVTVAKGVYVKLGSDGIYNNTTAATAVTTSDISGGAKSNYSMISSAACPTFYCTISIPDAEKAFGSSASTNATSCPTCTATTTNTADLTCDGSFELAYNNSGLITGGGITINNITLKTTGAAATMDELSSIKGSLNNTPSTLSTNSQDFTIAADKTNATVTLTTGRNTTADNNVTVIYTANGTSVLTPTTFDLGVKVNTTADVDTITKFVEFKEQGTTLAVSYLNANPDYRTFVRVTSSASSAIQAVVTTEDGMSSARVDVTKADGSAVTIGANGGAAVVEAADLLRSAQDAGFAGTGNRFNATIYVKTTGSVDAVAFQTANGSQRYLPVYGATGGGKL